jgi:hypothetical protein
MPADIPAFSAAFEAEAAWKRAGDALADEPIARLSGLARGSAALLKGGAPTTDSGAMPRKNAETTTT